MEMRITSSHQLIVEVTGFQKPCFEGSGYCLDKFHEHKRTSSDRNKPRNTPERPVRGLA
jgi:hypothetical protein